MNKLGFNKFTIYEVEELKKELLSLLKSSEKELIIDMSDVEKIDMAAIQLLISASKSAKKQSCNFQLYGLADAHKELLTLCGCHSLIGVVDEQ